MEVIVYSAKNCIYCKKQKDFLMEKGIEFEERDINENEKYFQEFKALGGVNYHFISEQKSHFFAHSFRKPSPLF
jgi:glutaredoxin